MPQTLLAFLAMMIAMLFSLNQQRGALHTQRTMIRNELAMQSTGVVEDVLGEIGALAFDEQLKKENDEADDASDLTLPGALGREDKTDDLDDFHEEENIRRYRTMQREVGGAFVTDTLWFAVAVDVTYADEKGAAQTSQTKFKKATVQVSSLTISDPATVKLSRLYACGSKCAW